MQKIILSFLLLSSLCSFSQNDYSWGIQVGVNQYYNKANFLSSRSGTGFTIGFVSTIPVSDNSEIIGEVNYSRFNMEFLGREELLSQPEWLKFHLDRFNFNLIYDYDILHFLEDDLMIGVCAGPSLAYGNTFVIDDEAKEHYLLDPYTFDADYMEIDKWAERGTLNLSGALGVTVRYVNLEAGLRYYKGLTNTYRNFPLGSAYTELKGKDNYATFTITYYFEEAFY